MNRKIFFLLAITALFAETDAFSQLKGKFRGGLDFGSIIQSDKMAYLSGANLGYNLQDNLNVGIKYGSAIRFGSPIHNGNEFKSSDIYYFSGTYTYYFGSRAKSLFIPYVGGGLGRYVIELDYSDRRYNQQAYDRSAKFGGFLTTGFELGKFRLAIEYHLLPESKLTVMDYNNYPPLEIDNIKIKNNYLGFTVGFYIGGGNRKKAQALAFEREKAAIAEKAIELEQEKALGRIRAERAALERERAEIERERTAQEVISPATANGQDIITMKNGDEIKAKVIEISASEIKYRRFENLDGATIVAAKKDVFAINYANGTREVINTVTPNTRNTHTGTSARKGKAAIGSNLILGIGDEYKHLGIGGKFFYNVTNRLCLASEFDFFPKQDEMSWWDFSMYGNYLLPINDNVTVYPSAGVGIIGVIIKEWDYSESKFAISFGGGIDIALTSNLALNVEFRYKLIRDLFLDHRTNFSVGLKYKFLK